MKNFVCFLVLFLVSGVASAQNISDIKLAPGEILVAINGVPVNNSNPNLIGGIVKSTGKIIEDAFGAISSRIVNRDPVAYNHALREAQILASRGSHGHPLGTAPGCTFTGTGISHHPEQPNHCYLNLGEQRLIARAVVKGKDGKYYWSAHYR